jgi:recombinational DNA repair protein RecT
MAAARVGLAFADTIAKSKNPDDFAKISRASFGAAITACALADLMPGGAAPDVWLIPKGGRLEVWFSHRGLMTLARRAGYTVRAVPVLRNESVSIIDGNAREHVGDPDATPATLDDLRGVYVVITETASGREIGRPWMSCGQIKARAKLGGPVWSKWPIEMAMKTAIKATIMRGTVPISAEANRALAAEIEQAPLAPVAQLTGEVPDATEAAAEPDADPAP